MKKLLVTVLSCACASVFAAWDWSGKTGDVELTEDATVTDADVSTVSALTGIVIPSGRTLTFANTVTELVLKANLSGAGAVTAAEGAKLTLSGDNLAYTGAMNFNKAFVTVASRYGLGSAANGRYAYSNGGGKDIGYLHFTGDGLTNDVGIAWYNYRYFSDGASLTVNKADPLVLNGPVKMNKGGNVDWLDIGSWTFNGDFPLPSGTPNYTIASDCIAWWNGSEFNCGNAYCAVAVNSGAELHLNTTLKNLGNGFSLYGSGKVVCERENVFPQSGYVTGLGRSSNKYGTLDLNGFNQKIYRLRTSPCSSWVWTPTKGEANYVSVTSAKPATLTIPHNGTDTPNFACRFMGKVSLDYTGTGIYNLVNQYSDTTGTLNASQGMVSFDWSAGWGGDVALTGSGKASFGAGCTLQKDGKSVVSLADTSKLVIADGVTLTCRKLTLGDQEIPAGTTCTAATHPDWIEGDGAIKVVDVFVADYTWTGAGTGWTDPASWDPAGVPGQGAAIAIPSGKRARVTDDDVSVVAAVSKINLASDSVLDFANPTLCTVSATLSGAGAVRSAKASLELAGDNIQHVGSMEFTNSYVAVTSRTGLGSPSRPIVHWGKDHQSTPVARLLFKGNGLTNDVPIKTCGSVANVATQFTENLTDPWVQNGNWDHPQGSNMPETWFGDYVMRGGMTVSSGNVQWKTKSGRTTTVNTTPIDVRTGMAGKNSYTHWTLESGARFILDVTGNQWNDAFGFDGSGTFVCGRGNVLDANHAFCLGGESLTTMDLNGHDQATVFVQNQMSTPWNAYAPAKGKAGGGIVTSEEPATLTMTANGDFGPIPLRFSDKASFRHTGTGNYQLGNLFSDTTGTLFVPAGTVTFDWNAGWGGDIAASGSGKVVFADVLTSLNKDKTSKVTLSDTAKLVLADGLKLQCAQLTLGDQEIPVGTTCSAATHPQWIEGDGEITVFKSYDVVRTWTGGGTGGWADPVNWGGEPAPGAGEKGVIPASSVIEVTDADVATVSAISCLEIGQGAVVSFINGTVACPLGADLLGAGAIRSLKSAGITLTGDNFEFTGPMEFTNTPVYVESRTGLGSPSRPILHWGSEGATSNDGSPLRFRGAGLTNDVPVRFQGQRQYAVRYFTDNKTDPWVQNGYLDYYKSGDVPAIHIPNLYLTGGWKSTYGSSMITILSGCTVTVAENPIDISAGNSSYYRFLIDTDATLKLMVPGNHLKWSSVYTGNGTLFCGCANAFYATDSLNLVDNSGNQCITKVDLNGFDQTVAFICHTRQQWTWAVTQANADSRYAWVTSAVPATVTMTGIESRDVALQFSGAASLKVTGVAKDNAGVYTIKNRYSDTTGTLDVSAGTVRFDWGAGWGGDIAISGTGRVEFVEPINRRGNKRRGAVSLAGSARLSLGAGVVLRCDAMTLGGKKIDEGAYSAAQLNALAGGEWIDGSGSVRIGDLGLSILVK